MRKDKNKKKLNGFSLFEVIVTMGILMMLSLLVFPVATNRARKSKLESHASQIATDLYYQQQRADQKNISTGISLGTSSYTLFDGDTLATATDTDVKSYPTNILITSITLNGTNEISFPQGEFKPQYYGYFNITDSQNTMRVYINQEGLIWYEEI